MFGISQPINIPANAILYPNGGYGCRGTYTTTVYNWELFDHENATYLVYEKKGYKIGDKFSFPDSDFHKLCEATKTGFKGIKTDENAHLFE